MRYSGPTIPPYITWAPATCSVSEPASLCAAISTPFDGWLLPSPLSALRLSVLPLALQNRNVLCLPVVGHIKLLYWRWGELRGGR